MTGLRAYVLARDESKKRTAACRICGALIQYYPSVHPRRQYCSLACANQAMRKPRACEECGAMFVRKGRGRFCSTTCYVRAERKRHEADKHRVCPSCGITFRRGNRPSQKYCSIACVGIARRRNLGDGPVGRKSYRGADWAKRSAAIRERDGYACRNCHKRWEGGMAFPVDHIKPWREFETAEEANDPSNLVTLCHSCHSRKTMTFEQRALKGDRIALNWWRDALMSGEGPARQRAYLLGAKAQERFERSRNR